jgi:Asp-tRNA(Asn)/Glu-tRNA(Gln) amidotransferase B subunit
MAKTAEGGSPNAAQSAAFRGKFIGAVMKELKGQADGSVVKEVVESLL